MFTGSIQDTILTRNIPTNHLLWITSTQHYVCMVGRDEMKSNVTRNSLQLLIFYWKIFPFKIKFTMKSLKLNENILFIFRTFLLSFTAHNLLEHTCLYRVDGGSIVSTVYSYTQSTFDIRQSPSTRFIIVLCFFP